MTAVKFLHSTFVGVVEDREMSASTCAPPWLLELRSRRRTAATSSSASSVSSVANNQSAAHCGPADMLLLESPPPPPPQRPADDDPAEELTYGPGIVKKLKSRYISLTLRETVVKPRPSLRGLRRAASLEHGLDDEPSPTPGVRYEPVETKRERPNRYRQPARTPESVKRARSVDALVRCDSRSSTEERPASPPPPPSPKPLPPSAPPPPPPPTSATVRPKRPQPLLKEAERPPPDLVKTALRIFETNPTKRTKAPPRTNGIADKIKAINGQKPAVPPRSPLLLSPEPRGIPAGTQTTPSLIARPPPSPKRRLAGPESPKPAEPSPERKRAESPNAAESADATADKRFRPEDNPDNNELRESERIARTSTPDPDALSTPVSVGPEISLIAARKDEESSDDGSVDFGDTPTSKRITRTALKNISDAGVTAQFSFGEVNGKAKKSHLPAAKPRPAFDEKSFASSSSDDEPSFETPFAKNPLIEEAETFREAKHFAPLTPLLIPKYNEPLPSELVPCKKADFIKAPSPPARETPKKITDESSPALIVIGSSPDETVKPTTRELAKNLRNKSKSLEQPTKKAIVSLIDPELRAPKLNGSSAKTEPAPAALTADTVESPMRPSPKKANGRRDQQQNTIVFKFTDRKGVPDYIENDGIVLRSSQRDRPKPSEVISLIGVGGESYTDSTDDADDYDGNDWAIWTTGPPSPCDVVFENDNVVINGRSNIAKPNSKPKKLKIQFDENLTRTFEYPSEASLIEDSSMSSNNTSPLAMGGSLSTFIPSKVLLQSDTYELGVTKSVKPATNGQKMEVEENDSSVNGDIEHNWSHETHKGAGDLLF